MVFCDVANLFGAPSAISRWENAYDFTQQIGLHNKPVLEGMSSGCLPIHNWAVKHPDKTAGIIGDNCVMDITSWPAGFGKGKGSKNTWETCKKAYGFTSDEEAKNFKLNPVNTIAKLADAKIPVLYLIADKDTEVPHDENSAKAARTLNGIKDYDKLKVIDKPGLGHHPHSLPNPEPIVQFALECLK